jgi:hypothetical protein
VPLPVIETVGLGYKILSLGWEMGKAIRNSAGAQWMNRSGYHLVSSLTTLEFIQNGETLISDYVQDRLVEFTRRDRRLPPFVYGTEGNDIVDNLVVDGTPQTFVYSENIVKPVQELLFNKGDQTRAVLLAHSTNGFPGKRESFVVNSGFWTDSVTLVVVFPPSKKPEHLEMLYHGPRDDADTWRPAKGEKYEVRRTTGGRLAFAWEGKNLRSGNVYKILWDW